jgi:hypothetical protein
MEQLVTSEVKTRRDPNPAFSFAYFSKSGSLFIFPEKYDANKEYESLSLKNFES